MHWDHNLKGNTSLSEFLKFNNSVTKHEHIFLIFLKYIYQFFLTKQTEEAAAIDARYGSIWSTRQQNSPEHHLTAADVSMLAGWLASAVVYINKILLLSMLTGLFLYLQAT